MKPAAVNNNGHGILSDRERTNIQNEIKDFLVRYFKKKPGNGVAGLKVDLYKEMLLIRIEGFLTGPEKLTASTASGIETVRASLGQDAREVIDENMEILEKKLGAKVFHQSYDIDPEKDFATYLIVFDRILTD